MTTNLKARELNRAELELECIGVDDERRLHRIAGDNPDEIHLVFVCNYGDQIEVFIRHDAEPAVVREVNRRSAEELWERPDQLATFLYGSPAPNERWWIGRAGHFARPYPTDSYPLVEESDGAFVVMVEDREVSRAESSRGNDRCAELGTETVEPYRRRGYATQVCRAWANHHLNADRIPFYSHRRENVASASLARALGIIPFMECVSYS